MTSFCVWVGWKAGPGAKDVYWRVRGLLQGYRRRHPLAIYVRDLDADRGGWYDGGGLLAILEDINLQGVGSHLVRRRRFLMRRRPVGHKAFHRSRDLVLELTPGLAGLLWWKIMWCRLAHLITGCKLWLGSFLR